MYQDINARLYLPAKFKSDFENVLVREVLPLMGENENERRKKLYFGISLSFIFILTILFFPVYWAIIAITAQWFITIALYEKQAQRYIPIIMKLIPTFSYFKISVLKLEDFKLSRMFPKNLSMNSMTRFHFFDSFTGKFSGVPVDISKFVYSYMRRHDAFNIFSGIVIRINTKKYFEVPTVLRPRGSKYYTIRDLVDADFEKVNIDDIFFTSQYAVYSQNPEVAKTYLPNKFLDAYSKFTKEINSSSTYCAFYGHYIYIGVTIPKLLKFSSIFDNLVDEDNYKLMYKNFASILNLVNSIAEIETSLW